MKENHKVDELLGNIAKLKNAIDEKDEVIEGLRNSLTETQLHLKTAIEEKDEVIVGLEKSKEESGDVIQGLNESKEEDNEMIKGLAKSKEEDADMIRGLEESVEEWKKTVDDIYNSTTWKIVSKFTKAQTKRK